MNDSLIDIVGILIAVYVNVLECFYNRSISKEECREARSRLQHRYQIKVLVGLASSSRKEGYHRSGKQRGTRKTVRERLFWIISLIDKWASYLNWTERPAVLILSLEACQWIPILPERIAQRDRVDTMSNSFAISDQGDGRDLLSSLMVNMVDHKSLVLLSYTDVILV